MQQTVKVDPALIPKLEVHMLCASVLEAVMRFYECPENVKGYEEWLKEQESKSPQLDPR